MGADAVNVLDCVVLKDIILHTNVTVKDLTDSGVCLHWHKG